MQGAYFFGPPCMSSFEQDSPAFTTLCLGIQMNLTGTKMSCFGTLEESLYIYNTNHIIGKLQYNKSQYTV